MFKVINRSGSVIGIILPGVSPVTVDQIFPADYRVYSVVTDQMKRLADPAMGLIQIVNFNG